MRKAKEATIEAFSIGNWHLNGERCRIMSESEEKATLILSGKCVDTKDAYNLVPRISLSSSRP